MKPITTTIVFANRPIEAQRCPNEKSMGAAS
jgi:hypothetical protein